MQRSDGREPARERSVSPGLTAAVDELPQEGTARSLLERWRSIEHEAKVGLQLRTRWMLFSGPILSVFPALIVHSELKSVHPGFPVAFIF